MTTLKELRRKRLTGEQLTTDDAEWLLDIAIDIMDFCREQPRKDKGDVFPSNTPCSECDNGSLLGLTNKKLERKKLCVVCHIQKGENQ